MTRFIILAQARSASSLLVNYLCSHPQVTCYHEPFRPRLHPSLRSAHDIPEAVERIFRTGLTPPLGARFRTFLRRLSGAGPIWSDHKQYPHRGSMRAVGFKITEGQLFLHWPQVLEWIRRQPSVHLIRLTRPGLLARLVSRLVAARSGVWHTARKRRQARPRLRIELGELLAYESSEAERTAAIEALLCDHPTPAHRLTYQELVTAPEETMRRVFAYLGVGPAAELHGHFLKLLQGETPDMVSNYEELRAALGDARLRALTDG
jgi:LPS sulfotransferase NodH